MVRVMTIFVGLVFFVSCSFNQEMESPFITIVKLNSAESVSDFEKAKQYIDVELTYSKFAEKDKSAEKAWKEYVQLRNDLSRDNKFTNVFKYHNYTILERVNGEDAEVVFESIKKSSKIQQIIYKLRMGDNSWKIIDIQYVKKTS